MEEEEENESQRGEDEHSTISNYLWLIYGFENFLILFWVYLENINEEDLMKMMKVKREEKEEREKQYEMVMVYYYLQ